MDFKTLVLKKEDNVATLTLNRPEVLNAIDVQMFDDLVDDFSTQFEYYYRGIMGPFKDKVLQAIDKIRIWR